MLLTLLIILVTIAFYFFGHLVPPWFKNCRVQEMDDRPRFSSSLTAAENEQNAEEFASDSKSGKDNAFVQPGNSEEEILNYSASSAISPDSIRETDDLSDTLCLSEDEIYDIERQLTKNERVSTGFLFFNDVDTSLKFCLKSSICYDYRGLWKFCKRNPKVEWCNKLLECFYLVKNYYLLEKYGIEKFVAATVFVVDSKILPERRILYQICELLTTDQANHLMEAISSVPNEPYLEIFFLRITDQWPLIRDVLRSFNDTNLSSLVASLDRVWQNTRETAAASISSDPVVPDCDVYPIKNPKHVGFCLIINQKIFVEHPERTGSEKDVEALEQVMNTLHFDVLTIENQPREFFGNPLITLISDNFTNEHSIFFFVVLSHGDRGTIICADDEHVSIEGDIFDILLSTSKLHNIPKVLIFQACQGSLLLRSLSDVETDGVLQSNIETDTLKLRPEYKSIIGDYLSDAIIIMSSVPGFQSFRQLYTGSYFIQYLCQCLMDYSDNDILDIITKVIKKVKATRLRTKIESLNVTQQPAFTSLLTKKLYLK